MTFGRKKLKILKIKKFLIMLILWHFGVLLKLIFLKLCLFFNEHSGRKGDVNKSEVIFLLLSKRFFLLNNYEYDTGSKVGLEKRLHLHLFLMYLIGTATD